METIKSTLTKPALIKIADALVNTQKEIDDLALQFSLGKAEASDKFEEIKQNAKNRFLDLRNDLFLKLGDERVHNFRQTMDDLEVQFALGKAETLEFYEEQRKKIVNALHNVEEELKKREEVANLKNMYITESERLKLKLDVLKKQFEERRTEMSQNFQERMEDARHEIDTLMSKAEERWDDLKDRYEDLTDEIKESSKKLKKAIDAW